MDVSFFGNQPYNTQNSLQGEIRGEENFWEYPKKMSQGGEIGEIKGILENILVEEKKKGRELEKKN